MGWQDRGKSQGVWGTESPKFNRALFRGRGPGRSSREGASIGRSGGGFGAPTAWNALQHMAVMEQPVEHRDDRGRIAQQLAPVLNRAVGGQQCAGTLVAPDDDFQQILGG